MKKNIFILSCLITLQSYAARIVEIHNDTGKPITIDVFSVRNTANILDNYWFTSIPVAITIEPGSSFILKHDNPGFQFPFNTPPSLSQPQYVSQWEAYVPGTGSNSGPPSIYETPSERMVFPNNPIYNFHGMKFWIGGIKGWGMNNSSHDDYPYHRYTFNHTPPPYPINNTLMELITISH